MKKIFVNELEKFFDKNVVISGFVDTVRDKKWVMFVILRDSTGKVQITLEKSEEKNNEMIETFSKITKDSVVEISGKVMKNEAVKLGGLETIPESVNVLSVASELPYDYNNLEGVNIDTRLDYRFLDVRNDRNMLIRQIESCMTEGMRDYLYKNNFCEIHTPKLIGAASESGSEVFEVTYFERKAYLAQSPQFYKQMALASGLDRVFEVGPVFRAENSNTYRHATEYTSFDLEFAYIDGVEDVMDVEEDLIISGLTKVKEKYGEVIKEVFGKEVVVPKKPFPRMDLNDVYKELNQRYGYKIPEEDVGDMNNETESLISKYAMEEFGHEFIFITGFSSKKRAFYHMRDENGIPMGYDLIWRGTEITTGAQREHRYDVLKSQAKEKGLAKDVEFYLDFFKYGCPPHGGFAIGLDRLTMLLLGLPSLKETMFLFRGPNRLEP